MIAEMVAKPTTPDQTPRAMPLAIAARVARSQGEFYREISEKVAAAWGGPVTREMALPIGASVRLLSACQDNQVAMDGLANGLFTSHLLRLGATAPSRATTPPSTGRSSARCRRTRPRTSSRPASRAPPTTPSGPSTSETRVRAKSAGPRPAASCAA